MRERKRAFTLVELMVVIVILAVLSTVGFIAYEDYLVDTRDSKRLTQMQNLRDALRLYITKGALPIPGDNIDIRGGENTFAYQGFADQEVLETISHDINTFDPLDETFYTYYLSKNRRDFQLLGYLEKKLESSFASSRLDVFASSVDYASRFPKVYGKELGIFIEHESKKPLQIVEKYKNQGFINIDTDSGSLLGVIVNDNDVLIGEGTELVGLTPFTTCKTIYDKNPIRYGKNGTYTINPTGKNPFLVYCDMGEHDVGQGGGWTFVSFIAKDGGNQGVYNGTSKEKYRFSREVLTHGGYGLDVSSIPHTEAYIAFGSPDLTSTSITNRDLIHMTYDYRYPPLDTTVSRGYKGATKVGFGFNTPKTRIAIASRENDFMLIRKTWRADILWHRPATHGICIAGYEDRMDDAWIQDLSLDNTVNDVRGRDAWYYVR